ncbi:hypothetical protein Poli38472_001922 [Pythium oligandrum]|uniref:F-ATPase gamma subunit n=1 Tax=Pythium oligandrum TaxID=41045 RepID=A0A8K1FNU6_PYTOL|nr:hypothetical protein Poli38472_001922 [Pythium oligandrum]|eukprot:TMW69766.1 hypothetical protein Poli38472_001922 [Pythium oligandrum]
MAEVTIRQQQDEEEVHILPQLKQPHTSSEEHKTLRLTHRRSVQPQDGDDDVNALPNHVKSKRNSVPVVRPTNRTLLPTLEAIEAITKAVQDELAAIEDFEQQQGEEEDVTSSRDEATRDLADLYCERARLLVEYTKYDTSVPLTEAFLLVDDGQEQDDVAKDVSAMQQGLTDAVTAISMNVELVIGYDLAARCARALGRIKYAINLTNLGLRVEAGNADLLQLKKELEVDTDTMRFTFAPSLLYRLETESNEVSGRQQAPSDMLQITTTTSQAEDFQARYHAMEVLSGSVMLRKMEQMMHHNIHHQCAKVDEVKALEAAFNQTMGFLAALLLDSTTTSRATNIEAITLENIGKQLTKSSVLVESNCLRRWAVGQQARGMATEKQILLRIGATSNIAKITKSMKMVSAAKMRGAELRMVAGRPFAGWLDNVNATARVIEKDGFIPKEEIEGENLFLVISSDRGLCGGINSGIAKTTRKQVSTDDDKLQLFILGDKGRAQLRRDFAPQIRGSATEAYVNPPNFAVASAIAEAILASAQSDNEKVHVIFNKFVSAIAYLPTIRSLAVSPDSEAFANYELEPADSEAEVLTDLKEFELATAVYHGIIENNTSEESSRMSAMENATSNAQDLISRLTLQYNKARQARITTELIEIISGASSLDG